MPSPIPRAAPVTIATCPSSRVFISSRSSFLTHLRMCVPTATSVPSWFLIVMSPVERRRSMSIALMRYSTVMVSPK